MHTDSAGKQHVIAFASRVLTPAETKLFSYSLRNSGRLLGTAKFLRHYYGLQNNPFH